MQTDGWPEKDEGKLPDMINEQDLLQAKNVILTWVKDLRAQPEVGGLHRQITLPVTFSFHLFLRVFFVFLFFLKFNRHILYTLIILQQSVWPGEPVAKVLEDLQSAWRWGRAPNLLAAMELVMWTLMLQRPDKVGVHFIIYTVLSALDQFTVQLQYSPPGVFLQDTIPQQWLMWKQRTQNIGL